MATSVRTGSNSSALGTTLPDLAVTLTSPTAGAGAGAVSPTACAGAGMVHTTADRVDATALALFQAAKTSPKGADPLDSELLKMHAVHRAACDAGMDAAAARVATFATAALVVSG